MNNKKVVARQSKCIEGVTTEYIYSGEIVKMNRKSMIVDRNHTTIKKNGEIVYDGNTYSTNKYTFWKEVDGKKLYRSSWGIFGVIEMPNENLEG